MFKDAATIITKPLAYIINLSLQSGSVPLEWKAAKVIPLFKIDWDTFGKKPLIKLLSANSRKSW